MKRYTASNLTSLTAQISLGNPDTKAKGPVVVEITTWEGHVVLGSYYTGNDFKLHTRKPHVALDELRRPVETLVAFGWPITIATGFDEDGLAMEWTIEYHATDLDQLTKLIALGNSPIVLWTGDEVRKQGLNSNVEADFTTPDGAIATPQIKPLVERLLQTGQSFTIADDSDEPSIERWSIKYVANDVTSLAHHIAAGHAPVIFEDGRKVLMANAPENDTRADVATFGATLSEQEVMLWAIALLNKGTAFSLSTSTRRELWSIEDAPTSRPTRTHPAD